MIPERMTAVHLTGYGGLDKLVVCDDVPVPLPGDNDVLIRVSAAGMNNTDINTRTGWYSPAVTSGTTPHGGNEGFGVDTQGMGDWTGDITFPRIQGADCAGRIAAVGKNVERKRIGERVICTPCLYDPSDPEWLDNADYLGAERDGAFAEFVRVPSVNAITVGDDASATDIELATLPCSGGTAMNMMLMAGLRKDDVVLVTGASGGVGTFLIQIARHAGARVVAQCSPDKADTVRSLGAHATIDRDVDDLVAAAHEAAEGARFSLVADVVGGAQFQAILALLRRGGRYVTSGAIAGPQVPLDLRTLYLKNLAFFGSTVHLQETIPTLVEHLRDGAIKPVVAETRPLADIASAQEAFLAKRHVGNMVLIPPGSEVAQ